MRLLLGILLATALFVSAVVLADPTQYRVETTDGKTFVVRDHLGRRHTFRAQRTCSEVRNGHTIMFELGGPNFTCVSASFRDVITGRTCSVWCVQAGGSSVAHLRRHDTDEEDHSRSTSLLDLDSPDAGTDSTSDSSFGLPRLGH